MDSAVAWFMWRDLKDSPLPFLLVFHDLADVSAVRAQRRCRGAPTDRNGLHPNLRLGLGQIDMQQPVIQPGASHFDPFRQDERPLKLARGNAAMKKDPALAVIRLTASDYQLVIFLRKLQVIHGKAGNRERYP